MSNTLGNNRGRVFTPAEDLLLARAWVRASAEGTDQDATDFWDNVKEAFNFAESRLTHFGSIAPRSIDSRNRTAQPVRCRWTLVQRVAQKYIAARKTVLRTTPSGTNPSEEEVREATMLAYQSLHKSNDNDGNSRLAPRVKFVDACMYLTSIPKCGLAPVGKESDIGTTAAPDCGNGDYSVPTAVVETFPL
jgi:hypothetical protein